jgi:integrase
LRWGEAAALRIGRVDLLHGRLEIGESVTEIRGKAVFGLPKTHQERPVPVPTFLRREIAGLCEGRSADDYAFTASRGGVLRQGPIRRDVWNPACVAVALGSIDETTGRYSGLVPHEVRHAAASFAIASGASVKGVQSMLGHESATQTLERYEALWGDELSAVAERIGAARQAEISRSRRGLSVVRPNHGDAASSS